MPNDLTPPDPTRFNLTSFAELLPARDHILGEDAGSFDGFHQAMMQSLAPGTPYECVIAENLVAIEWELIQHRRMRDAGLRKVMRNAILNAVLAREEAAYEAAQDETWEAHERAGGTEEDWETSVSFDRAAAEAKGRDLSAQTISQGASERAAANAQIEAMGLNVIELMGEAYRTSGAQVRHHDTKGSELERRRREVRRDFDVLQKHRPIDAEVIEG